MPASTLSANRDCSLRRLAREDLDRVPILRASSRCGGHSTAYDRIEFSVSELCCPLRLRNAEDSPGTFACWSKKSPQPSELNNMFCAQDFGHQRRLTRSLNLIKTLLRFGFGQKFVNAFVQCSVPYRIRTGVYSFGIPLPVQRGYFLRIAGALKLIDGSVMQGAQSSNVSAVVPRFES